MKKEQMDSIDYLSKDTLLYVVNRCLARVEKL